ncbi:MAG: hypothetical protein Kow00127_00460 [Bacteroidales bacterium]
MKRFIFLICAFISLLISTDNEVKGQIIYSCDSRYDADIIVFAVESKYDADLWVYKCESRYEPDGNKGLWYFTESRYDADKLVWFSDSKYDADLLIWFTDSKYEAGWRKRQKIHLLF